MIAALLCGIEEKAGSFPGRNLAPLLGRPLMTYPLLAAKYAENVDRVFLSTDSQAMSDIAEANGAEIIHRPAELCRKEVPIREAISHGLREITAQAGKLEALIVLLCNSPGVSPEMIDNGISQLRDAPDSDAIASVARHNEFNPLRAKHIDNSGFLRSLTTELHSDYAEERDSLGDVFFIDGILWIIRPDSFRKALDSSSQASYFWLGEHILPLVHESGVDIDYESQIPMAEYLLRRRGFSSVTTPYDQLCKTEKTKPEIAVTGEKKPYRVLITTVPFGEIDPKPLELLQENNIDYTLNPIGRKMKEEELYRIVPEFDIVIAGTEPNTRKVIENAPRLKLISRVGIGLDSVDLAAARENDVLVSYTPDAPSPAVAELTVGMMMSLIRMTNRTDRNMRQGVWKRWMGKRLQNLTVGIVGTGRIGKLLTQYLQGFHCRIIANDLEPDKEFGQKYKIEYVDKETLYREADIITVHVPLKHDTKDLITLSEMRLMKNDAVLINTARGGIINQQDLATALREEIIGAAGIDVYEREPYTGELTSLDNCLLTCHMGSCSSDCRFRMELEATEEAVRFCLGQPLKQLVTEQEYRIQAGKGS